MSQVYYVINKLIKRHAPFLAINDLSRIAENGLWVWIKL